MGRGEGREERGGEKREGDEIRGERKGKEKKKGREGRREGRIERGEEH